MKPVMQTTMGERGNCMSACLASILEIPLEEVPNFFDAGADESSWWNACRAWLKGYGLGVFTVAFDGPARWTQYRLDGYHIVSGQSTRGLFHATVWHRGAMVHDPHPDSTGLAQPEQLDVLYMIDPARHRAPLAELVALKRLKDSLPELAAKADAGPWSRANDDYKRRQPLAWAAAFAAVDGVPDTKGGRDAG